MIRYHERYYTKRNQKLHGLFKPTPVVLQEGKKYKLRSLVVSGTGKIKACTTVVLKRILDRDEVEVASTNGKVWGIAGKEQLINVNDDYYPVPTFEMSAQYRMY